MLESVVIAIEGNALLGENGVSLTTCAKIVVPSVPEASNDPPHISSSLVALKMRYLARKLLDALFDCGGRVGSYRPVGRRSGNRTSAENTTTERDENTEFHGRCAKSTISRNEPRAPRGCVGPMNGKDARIRMWSRMPRPIRWAFALNSAGRSAPRVDDRRKWLGRLWVMVSDVGADVVEVCNRRIGRDYLEVHAVAHESTS